ncbi:MAG: leucine-rich repeat domain-containing protein [Muribaculaceae bacterium]|nr:leucine-rich repeat domain-containing protein [Muribaculaceae bacterium]
MRKNLLAPVMLSVAAMCVSPVSAEVVGYTTSEGMVYNVDMSAGTAVLARVEASTGISDLTVPDEIVYGGETYDVVAIGDGACLNNTLLASVKVGEKVATIGVQSFYGCQTLASATLPSSLRVIGDQAFYNCKALASPVLPEGLEAIGSYAFWSNNAATEVRLPSSLAEVGGNPWGCCPLLSSFSIADDAPNFAVVDGVLFDKKVETLISYPVANMVTEYATPSTTRVIKDNSMRNNSLLTSVTLNEGLEVIGVGAFNVCRFTEITIPASVVEIGQRAFTSNPLLAEFKVEEGNEHYAVYNKFLCTKDGKILLQGLNIEDVVIPESVEDIEEYAFYNMSSIKTVKLSNTKSVGQSAFYSGRQITDIDFGTSLESIDNMAFMYCTSVKEIVFPSTLRTISNKQAFLGCTMLERLVLNEGIEKIGDGAFLMCIALKEVYIPGSVKEMGEAIFSNCPSLESVEFGEGLLTVGSSCVYANSGLKKVKMPDSVVDIKEFAFGECPAIEEINIPASLESVGTAAFQNVPLGGELRLPSNLKKVDKNAFTYTQITDLVTNDLLESIGDWAFGGNYGLRSVSLNEGLVSIGQGAFAASDMLVSIEIPSTVTAIGDGFLSNCNAVVEIINNAVEPQALTGDPVSADAYAECVLKVPMSSVNAYGNAPYWQNFYKIEGIGSDSVERVGEENITVSAVYDLNGVRVDRPVRGIYVVRYSDGSVRKISVD